MSEKDEFTWESLADPNFDTTEYFEQNFPENHFFIGLTGRKEKVKPAELKDINDNNWTNDSAFPKQQAEDKQKNKKKPKNANKKNENKQNPEEKKKKGRKNKKTKKIKEAKKKPAYRRVFQENYSMLPPNWFEYLKELMSDFTGKDDDNFWLWERELYLLRDTYNLDDSIMKTLICSKLKMNALAWYKSESERAQMPVEELLTAMARVYDRGSTKLPLWKKAKKQRWCKSKVYNLCLHEKLIPASCDEPDPREFIPLQTRAAKHDNVPPHMLVYYYVMNRKKEVLNHSCRRFYKPKQPQNFKIFNDELDPVVHFPRMKKRLIKRSPLRQGFEGDKPRKSLQRRKGAGRNKRPRGCKLKVNIFRRRLVIATIAGEPRIGRKVLFVRCMNFSLQRC